MSAWELLPVLRELFSSHPEMRYLEAYHLAWALYVLGYTTDLESEHEMDSARAPALAEWTGGEAA